MLELNISVYDNLKELKPLGANELVDALGEVKQYLKQLEKVENTIRAAFDARRPENAEKVLGAKYTAMISHGTRVSLDGEKIKKEKLTELGDEAEFNEWLQDHSKTTEFTQVRVVKNDEAAEDAKLKSVAMSAANTAVAKATKATKAVKSKK